MKMTVSRKLLAPALLAIAIAPLALSATAAHHGKGAERHKEYHQEQREQWMEARTEQRQALFQRAGIDEPTREALEEARGEHREAMRQLHEQHRERLNQLLDDDQRAAMEVARGEMREERRAEMMGQRRASMQERLEALVDDWGLSGEEREALRETREEIYADMAKLRERDFDSRTERRDAMLEMRDRHQEALAEILSDEQMEELRATMMPRGERGDGKGYGKPDRGHGEKRGN